MFSISNTPIDIDALKQLVNTPEAGAYVAFEGWVRENNEGKKVTALEYEAYEELAVKEGQKILEEARKFDILKAQCVHRTGQPQDRRIGCDRIGFFCSQKKKHSSPVNSSSTRSKSAFLFGKEKHMKMARPRG